MTHKSYASYAAVLQCLSQKAAAFFPDDPRPIKWESTLTDFETGLLPAIRDHNFLAPPPIAVKGCHFHHTESIWRQIQREGLTRQYRVDEGFKNFIKGLFAIPFLPPHEVEDGYNEFIASAASRRTTERYPRLLNICHYYENTWLHGNFPIPMWNVYDVGEIRTNNNIEGWHRDCNDVFGQHSSLWKFLSTLHSTQKKEEGWFAKLCNGNRRALSDKRKKKYQQKEDSLKQLKDDYDNGYFPSKVDYIVAVSRFQGAAHGEEDIRQEDLAFFEGEEAANNDDGEVESEDEYEIEGQEQDD